VASESLRNRSLPQQAHWVGPGTRMRSRGICSGNGLRAGGLGGRALCGELVLGGGGFDLFEAELHLVEKLAHPF
jgi:hypothetical protein